MRLEEHEYDIVDEAINDGGIGIFITKEALEKWRDHYQKTSDEQKRKHQSTAAYFDYYLGKAAVLTDILKHFEEEYRESMEEWI